MKGLAECLASRDEERLCRDFLSPLAEDVVRRYKTEVPLSWHDREDLSAECAAWMWMRRGACDASAGDERATWFFRRVALRIVQSAVRKRAIQHGRDTRGSDSASVAVA